MQTRKTLGLVTVTGSYVLWGFLTIYWGFLDQVNSLYLLAQRIIWSMVAMGLYLLIVRGFGEIKRAFKDKQVMKTCFIAGVLITLNWGIYIYAVTSGHVIDASMGYFIEPVIVCLIGVIAFREKPTLPEKLTFLCATAGIVFLVVRTGRFPVLALAVGIPFAIYGAVKKNLTLSAQGSLFMETLLMLPFAAVFCLWWTGHMGGYDAVMNGTAFWLIPLSGVVTSVPLLLFNIGVKELPYYFTGILMYINPTLQFLTGLVYFHEPMDTNRFIAFVIIWVGIFIALGEKGTKIRQERKKALTNAPAPDGRE